MNKKVIALVIGVLALFALVIPKPVAEAMTQYDLYHSNKSQRTYMRVWDGWSCNGRNDFVPRSAEAEIWVRSISVPAGYSLWFYIAGSPSKWAAKKKYSRCVSMRGVPVGWSDVYWALLRK
jgi:hypothetical protein